MKPSPVDLSQVRAVYIAYGQIKFALEDWHAVRDIAAELEVLDTRIACTHHQPTYPRPGNLSVAVPAVDDSAPPAA